MVLEFMRKNRLLSLVALVYGGLLTFAPAQGVESVSNSVYYLKEMFQVLPIIFLLTAVIEAWVPKDLIMRRLGDSSGVWGALLSLVLGSISVGPVYAAFPISKMLIAKGASISNIVIILSSWAVIKVPMLANEAKFLGVKFMLARWVLTVISILVIGRLVSTVVRREDIPSSVVGEQKGILSVNEPYCVGCGVCARLLPQVFEMKNNKAVVKPGDTTGVNNLSELITKCPTRAILLGDSTAAPVVVATT